MVRGANGRPPPHDPTFVRPRVSRTTLLRAAASTAGVLLACAPLARAQNPASAQTFCAPGATGSCFAFSITDEATGFDVWLRNLSPYGRDVADPFAVRQFSIYRVNTPDPAGARTDLSSGFRNAGVVTTGSARRGEAGLSENTGYLEFPPARAFTYTAVPSYGLLGCALPPDAFLAAEGFVAVTCAGRGLDGWLRIAFGARVLTERPAFGGVDARTATAADVAVEVAGCLTHIGASSGVSGPFGGAVVCAPTPFALDVVPEPATTWTVAAGLAGVLAAARARRTRGA